MYSIQYSSVTLKCTLLLCVCSPGMNADEEMDGFLKKTCSDADVFVYVCDGTCTIENTVCTCECMLRV